MDLNLLNHPICFARPRRLTPLSAWHEHIPFAMLLVDILRPSVFVELGTHCGDSYCAFCQAVDQLHLSTRCYAIDTWIGDQHSGFYGFDVLADLQEHHDRYYGSFSKLIQSTFDEALHHFDDGTIDLLHIDGYHRYESVKHDFMSWLPRMSAHGVILFHDINSRESDFGVWKLWDELKDQYSHFNFLHGHGLGVLALGNDYPKAFQELLEIREEDAMKIRNLFSELGHNLTLRTQLSQQLTQLQENLQRQEQEMSQLQENLQTIHASMGWKLLNRYWTLENKLLAPGTKRRKVYDSILMSIRSNVTNTNKED